MSSRTIVDTGPLVAYFYKSDSYHEWAAQHFAQLRPPLVTCESVVSEACFLLKGAGVSPIPVMDLVTRGALKVDFSLDAESDSVRRLMARYSDIGISLADACLIRMSESHTRSQVMTIDRDFLIYRRDGRRAIPLIAPFAA